ncbi:hypothetical protein C8R43DRAFT_958075 [Mycena crocata]|nr:hypothetical protein C8R43DRAFT_958075 [Mycena crocata]
MVKKSTKLRQRRPKEHRRNLRFWAEGAREDILMKHFPAYADAVENRRWRDERAALETIVNEFHARISWRLADHEEPELPLPEYDPLAPVMKENLSPEDTEAKRLRIEVLNKRIRRWLQYRVRLLHKQYRPKLDGSKNGWAVLLAKLSGVQQPPKARQRTIWYPYF